MKKARQGKNLFFEYSNYRESVYIEKLEGYFRAGTWILAILVFAYVDLFGVLFQKIDSPSFYENYTNTQSALTSLIVNFGIVVLLVFDNSNEVFQSKSNRYACVAFGLTIFIYGHAKNFMEDNSQALWPWLNTEYIACLLFMTYYIMVIHIRYLSQKLKVGTRDIIFNTLS